MDWDGFCSVNSAKSMTLEDEENSEYSDKQIILYPNPSNGTLTIQANETIQSVLVFDLKGTKLYEQNVYTDAIELSLTLKTGIYILSITLENGNIETHKISIQ